MSGLAAFLQLPLILTFHSSCWRSRLHRLALLVSVHPAFADPPRLTSNSQSIIETQALVAELLENFEFRLPAGADPSADHKKSELQCAPSGAAMVPLIRGKPELGPSLRLRVSLAPTD